MLSEVSPKKLGKIKHGPKVLNLGVCQGGLHPIPPPPHPILTCYYSNLASWVLMLPCLSILKKNHVIFLALPVRAKHCTKVEMSKVVPITPVYSGWTWIVEYGPPLKPPVANESCKLYLPIMQTFSFLITVSLSLDAMILKKRAKNPVGGQSAVCYRCNWWSLFLLFSGLPQEIRSATIF